MYVCFARPKANSAVWFKLQQTFIRKARLDKRNQTAFYYTFCDDVKTARIMHYVDGKPKLFSLKEFMSSKKGLVVLSVVATVGGICVWWYTKRLAVAPEISTGKLPLPEKDALVEQCCMPTA